MDCIALALTVVTRTDACPFPHLKEVPSGSPSEYCPCDLIRACEDAQGNVVLVVDLNSNASIGKLGKHKEPCAAMGRACDAPLYKLGVFLFHAVASLPPTPLSDLYPQHSARRR